MTCLLYDNSLAQTLAYLSPPTRWSTSTPGRKPANTRALPAHPNLSYKAAQPGRHHLQGAPRGQAPAGAIQLLQPGHVHGPDLHAWRPLRWLLHSTVLQGQPWSYQYITMTETIYPLRPMPVTILIPAAAYSCMSRPNMQYTIPWSLTRLTNPRTNRSPLVTMMGSAFKTLGDQYGLDCWQDEHS